MKYPSIISLAVALLAFPAGGRATEPVREPTSIHDTDALTVMSLNLAMREDVTSIGAELAAVGADESADLILLQEVVKRDGAPDVAWQLGQMLGLESAYHEAFSLGAHRSVGLALLSRYPQRDVRVLRLPRFDLSFRSRQRIALGAAVETPAGPLHVYNVHLDTRINIGDRIEQLAGVTQEVGSLDGPAIVGGDFNTNDNRWLFHTIPLPFVGRQGTGVLRLMEGLGFRSAFGRGQPTHDAFRMQLDWVFLRGLHASAASIHPLRVSDHHALLVSITRPVAPRSTTAR